MDFVKGQNYEVFVDKYLQALTLCMSSKKLEFYFPTWYCARVMCVEYFTLEEWYIFGPILLCKSEKFYKSGSQVVGFDLIPTALY
jgi:hypothetical protein